MPNSAEPAVQLSAELQVLMKVTFA